MDLSKDIDRLANFEDKALFLFQKKTYESAFSDYKAEAADFIANFTKNDFDAESASEQFIEYYQNQLSGLKGIKALGKSKVLYNHNMYMVCYVLPYFVELEGAYKEFADLLVQKWNRAFKRSHISAASFSEVAAGFVTRLFGTVVSES